VVRLLSAQGVKVRALVRDPAKAASLQGANVEIVQGDLADVKSLDAAFRGAEKLFLLSSGDPSQVELQRNALDAARRAGVKHVVKMSALGADPNSPVGLSRWHAQTEDELKKSGLAWTILQPHFFMQNLAMMAATIKTQGTLYAPLKDGKIAMVDARDIAAVAVRTLTEPGHEGKTYIVTGPEAISFQELAQQLGTVLGKPVKYVDIPLEDARKGMQGAGMPEWFVNDLCGMYGFFATGGGAWVADTVSTVGKVQPRTFQQFAKDHAQLFA
jgi:uncharacterized protein YbjT (DUF2867 family)